MSATANNKSLRIWLMVAACVLFLAVIPIWPYGLYTLLRFLVCGTTAYAAFKSGEVESLKSHKIPLIIMVVLYNPLVPVHLVRLIWLPIDIVVGLYLLILRSKIKE